MISKDILITIYSFLGYNYYIRNGGNDREIVRALIRITYNMSIREYMAKCPYPYLPLIAIQKLYDPKIHKQPIIYDKKTYEFMQSYKSKVYDPYYQEKMKNKKEREKVSRNPLLDEQFLRESQVVNKRDVLLYNTHVEFKVISKFFSKPEIKNALCMMQRDDMDAEYLVGANNIDIDWENITRSRSFTKEDIELLHKKLNLSEIIIENRNTSHEVKIWLMENYFSDTNYKDMWEFIHLTNAIIQRYPKKCFEYITNNETLDFALIRNNLDIFKECFGNGKCFLSLDWVEFDNHINDNDIKLIIDNMDMFDLHTADRDFLFRDDVYLRAKKWFDKYHSIYDTVLKIFYM